MEIHLNKSGQCLETPKQQIDCSGVWPVALSALEQILGKDAAGVLCFHIFERTGLPVGTLLIEDPERFEETLVSILQCDIRFILSKVCYSVSREFGLDKEDGPLHIIVEELKKN